MPISTAPYSCDTFVCLEDSTTTGDVLLAASSIRPAGEEMVSEFVHVWACMVPSLYDFR